MKRYACLHGHFYQPPRENPWTGAVERQPSAGRDHDWNARIARECYLPNGEARVLDGRGRLVDAVDNYAWMSFNFGPTLLSWLEAEHPDAHARLIAADRASAARLDGHGNALAQAYHHAILPLCSPRDRRTEILWGLADFRRRFGREAEGMWLPECAADDATLSDLAGAGVKFAILEPHQAEAVRAPGGAWKPAADALAPGVPYLWTDGARRLALFFYDGPLSRAVAFEGAMRDSRAFAGRLAASKGDGLVLLATDGESYGHHEPFAEMGLAHLLRYALPEKGLEPVNPAWFLSRRAPSKEVRLKTGGTSWSCAHGVERWRSDCGCGAEGGRRQSWRAPLRASLEWLRDELAALYEEKAAGLLSDPWAARDAYGEVVAAGPGADAARERWLAAWAPGARDAESRARALELAELQRHALMMFTSCGWFFDELSRLEPTQVLLYAARALELARAFGRDFEPAFVARLAEAPSNDPALKDGRGVWEALVKTRVVGPDETAAHYAALLLFSDAPPARAHRHAASCARFTRRVESGVTVAAGRAAFADGATGRRWERTVLAAILPGQRVQSFVCAEDLPEERLQALMSAAARGAETDLPPGRLFRLRDLRPDDRERLLTLALQRRLSRWEAAGRGQLDDALPLAEQYAGLGLPLPAGLGEETRLALGRALAEACRRYAEGRVGALDEIKAVAARAKAAGFDALGARAEDAFAAGTRRTLAGLENGRADESLDELIEAAEAAAAAGLREWLPAAQARAFRWLKSRRVPDARGERLAALLSLSV